RSGQCALITRTTQLLSTGPRSLFTWPVSSTQRTTGSGCVGAVLLPCHMHRDGIVPRLPRHHVGDFHVAPFEFARGGIDESVFLSLLVDRLGVEQQDANLSW